MKGKKSAFTNSSTGYAKAKHNFRGSSQKSNKTDLKNNNENKSDLNNIECKLDHDKDLNSGFGDYLRSPEGMCICIFL